MRLLGRNWRLPQGAAGETPPETATDGAAHHCSPLGSVAREYSQGRESTSEGEPKNEASVHAYSSFVRGASWSLQVFFWKLAPEWFDSDWWRVRKIVREERRALEDWQKDPRLLHASNTTRTKRFLCKLGRHRGRYSCRTCGRGMLYMLRRELR